MKESQKEIVLAALEKFHKVEIIVGGWSMWPFIRNGDTIRIRKITKSLNPGKVAVFFNGDQLIAHRVIWKKSCENSVCYWISGDYSNSNFDRVEETEIVGFVDKIGKKWRLRTLWLHYPLNLSAPFIGFFLAKLVKVIEFIKSSLQSIRK